MLRHTPGQNPAETEANKLLRRAPVTFTAAGAGAGAEGTRLGQVRQNRHKRADTAGPALTSLGGMGA